jgi:hypothetical protein
VSEISAASAVVPLKGKHVEMAILNDMRMAVICFIFIVSLLDEIMSCLSPIKNPLDLAND